MKKIFNDYMSDNISLEKWQKLGIFFLVFVLSGIFGWIYELIFYFFDSGMKGFCWQGGNFLPWINIYVFGAILIIIFTRKFKKNPLIVFLLSMIITGLLEYIAGFLIYNLFDGLRLWDYNTEILNYGNIDGFVCLRSVLFFGVSALFLMYCLLPFCIYLSKKASKKPFLIVTLSLFSIFFVDEIYNLIIARIFNLPRAYDIYTKLGFKYHY